MKSKHPTDMPWHIRTETGTFVAGYESVEEATKDAENRNEKLQKMGLDKRHKYSMTPKP